MIPRVALLLFLLAASSGVRGVQGEEIYSQETCSLCHIRQSVFFDERFALPKEIDRFDEERVCASCHNGSVRDSRDSLWRGAQHPAAVPGGQKPGRKRCSGCHTPHGKGGWDVLAGTQVSLRRGGDAVCTGCHGGYASGSKGIHRTGFPGGGCRECHRAHGGIGKNLLRESGDALCFRCHPAMRAERGEGHPLSDLSTKSSGGKSLPRCTSCHPVHQEKDQREWTTQQCRACHAMPSPKSGEGANPHPAEAECLSCHAFHANRATGGKGLRGKDMRPETLCGTCHVRHVAESVGKGREKATHVTRRSDGGEDLCLRCHRVHGGSPGTRLLASAKPYSCLDCHERQNTISETAGIILSHPVFERVEKGRLAETVRQRGILLGPAGEIVCGTCHLVHRAMPATPLLARGFEKAESCLWCHKTMRGKDHLPAGKSMKGAECETCHMIHGKPVVDGRDPWETVCSSCHERKQGHPPAAEDRSVSRPPGLPGFDAKGRKVSIGGGISCPTCHETHGRPATGKRLRKDYVPSAFLCSACHKEKEAVALTPHDLRGIAGNSICEPCHLPHGGSSPWMWGLKAAPGDKGKEACRSCHKEKGMASPMADGGHPVNVIVPRPLPNEFPLYGEGGKKIPKGVMTCPTCHEVHGTGIIPLGGSGTGKLLRPPSKREGAGSEKEDPCLPCHTGKGIAHGKSTCLSCHPQHRERKVEEACRECHPARPGGMARIHEAGGKGCAACHPMHDQKTRVAAEGRCLSCHQREERIRGTPHAGTGKGTCAPCHPAHEDPVPFQENRKPWEETFPPDLACLRCHNPDGTGTVPMWTEHPKKRKKVATSYGATVTMESPIPMISRMREGSRPLFPLFDEAGAKSQSGRMGCLTCHDPHAGTIIKREEEKRTASGYLRDPSGIFLADVCANCHRGEAGDHVRKFHRLPRKTD